MRQWLTYVLVVVASTIALVAVASASPRASSVVLLVGCPVLVTGAGLGAKFVKESRRARKTRPQR